MVHLHRRAGFATGWAELQRDLEEGPEASVGRLLAAGKPSDEFESTASLVGDAAVASHDLTRLQAWWLFRMLHSPDPLAERLTLLWHNHFATGFAKVQKLELMRRQNDTFLKLARDHFGELLAAALREPALLIYLDAPANRKGHPNENLARELMELFTLGIGHYTEADVREAARALTGWTVENDQFRDIPRQHDNGETTVLGLTTKRNGADLLAQLAAHPATATRLASRLVGLFFGEAGVDAGALSTLASGLRERQLDVGWGVETILRSRAFFAAENIGNRVLGPAEWLVGAVRALVPGSAPSTLLLAEWAGRVGQTLFDPPNVGGWPGGRSWLTSRSIIARTNFASALVSGRELGLDQPLDPFTLTAEQGRASTAGEAQQAAAVLLLGREPSEELRKTLPDPASRDPEPARQAITALLAAPESQLG